jgi:hypothetical protein
MKEDLTWLALAGLLAAGAAAGAELRLESGTARTVMIELFTSQGCNSCPPAEAYLNGYIDHPALWTTYIPLAFHVDYWDDLGWKDRFALADNAARQRRYARLGGARTVYTPAFRVNGEGWAPGLLKRSPRADGQAAGNLSLTLRGREFQARYDARAGVHKPLVLHVALLGMGLTTEIEAGENRGRQSRHEFVVLAHEQLAGEGNAWQGSLPAVDTASAARLGIVAWLSQGDDPTPVQATGGYLPAPERDG